MVRHRGQVSGLGGRWTARRTTTAQETPDCGETIFKALVRSGSECSSTPSTAEIEGFHTLTGVRERDRRLYMDSLYDSAIAVLDM